MIDTIKGYIDISDIEFKQISHLTEKAQGLSNGSFIHYKVQLSNFTIRIILSVDYKPIRLRFEGSLAKFYFGNNLSALDPYTCKKAIDMLSDNLQVNILEAILTRIDFGVNLSLQFPVDHYVSSLISYRNYNLLRYQGSITFISPSNSKSLCFYDKIKEIKKDKDLFLQIPDDLRTLNILRYELRLQKRLARLIGMKEVKVKHLTVVRFHRKLGRIWFKSYQKVNKFPVVSADPLPLIQKRNGLLKYLSFHGIEKLSYGKVLSIISNLKFNVKNPGVKRSKMKALVRELIGQAKEDSLEHNLEEELEVKIHQAFRLL